MCELVHEFARVDVGVWLALRGFNGLGRESLNAATEYVSE